MEIKENKQDKQKNVFTGFTNITAGLIADDIQSNVTINKEYPIHIKEQLQQHTEKINMNKCPSIGEYKTVIGNDVMAAIEGYFKFIKKSKKDNKIPREQQLFFEKAVACHLLLELTHHALKAGWQWGIESVLNNNKDNKNKEGEIVNGSIASISTDNTGDSDTTN